MGNSLFYLELHIAYKGSATYASGYINQALTDPSALGERVFGVGRGLRSIELYLPGVEGAAANKAMLDRANSERVVSKVKALIEAKIEKEMRKKMKDMEGKI